MWGTFGGLAKPLAEDFGRAVALLREGGIAFAPTFVAFTPWTALEGQAFDEGPAGKRARSGA